jgi:glycosyltransferase involved in cell wall biosynthesis
VKILYYHQYFTTHKGSGGVRSYEFAKRWVTAGHDVHMVTGTSFDPTLPQNGDTNIEGIHVTSVGVRYSAEMGFFARIKSFALYALKSIKIAMGARHYDWVLASSTPLTVAFPALAAKWIAGRKVIFEVRDVWPDAAVDAGVLKNPVLIFLARLLEKAVYASSNHIVPLSVGMQNRLNRKGVNNSKMTMIPNCSDISVFRPDINGAKLRKKFQAENKFIMLYAGAVNFANDCGYLVEVADILKTYHDIQFWIVGKGNRFNYLKEEAKKRSIHNIIFHGLQPRHKIPYYAAAADVGLVTFIPQPVFYDNSPNKFFDYIAAGLPVLFNRSTWLETYLTEYENGYICDAYTPSTMAECILNLMKNPLQCKKMGSQSRKLAEEVFSRDQMAHKYLELMYSH